MEKCWERRPTSPRGVDTSFMTSFLPQAGGSLPQDTLSVVDRVEHPDHNTLWRFYRRHRQSMREGRERAVIRTYDARRLQELLERVET